MASQFSVDRHVAARNTILLWLGVAIVAACAVTLLTYHVLRDDSVDVAATAPLLSERNSTMPARDRQALRAAMTDSTAAVARAHDDAVADAASATTATPAQAQPAAAPQAQPGAANTNMPAR
jgi:hypothetical protein